jgi:hypothetical protein
VSLSNGFRLRAYNRHNSKKKTFKDKKNSTSGAIRVRPERGKKSDRNKVPIKAVNILGSETMSLFDASLERINQ